MRPSPRPQHTPPPRLELLNRRLLLAIAARLEHVAHALRTGERPHDGLDPLRDLDTLAGLFRDAAER